MDYSIEELELFLRNNYVVDEFNMFRLHYSKESLEWILKTPTFNSEFHFCVRDNSKMIGFLSASPMTLKISGCKKSCICINFFCIDAGTRRLGLAKELIGQLRKRCGLDFTAAIATSPVSFGDVMCECAIWNRFLNVEKLIRTEFMSLTDRMTLTRAKRLFEKFEDPNKNFRPMVDTDAQECWNLFEQSSNKFDISVTFDFVEFCHWFLPRPNVIFSFVVTNGLKISGFISFYQTELLTRTESLKIANLFHVFSIESSFVGDLLNNALIWAKRFQFDAFSVASSVSESDLTRCKFKRGNGSAKFQSVGIELPEKFSREKLRLTIC